MALVGDLVKHVIKIVERVDYFTDIRFLNADDGGNSAHVYLLALSVTVRVAVDAVDVIIDIEWMPDPRIAHRLSLQLDTESLKEHDADIDPVVARLHDAAANMVKVRLVERVDIKLGLAVQGQPGPGAAPRDRT